jgi:UDP-glucose 4-epimerase
MINKILCTGHQGFIGSKLHRKLNCDGVDIKSGVDIVTYKKKKEYDYIIHCAAQISVPDSKINPIKDATTNILGTINLLQQHPKAKHIYLSSCAVLLGDSPYALSKLIAEKYIELLAKNYLIVRLTNVVGDGEDEKEFKNVFTHFKYDNPLIVYGDPYRDFIDVDWVADEIINNLDTQGTIELQSGKLTRIRDLAKKMANGRKIIYKKLCEKNRN